MKKLILIFAFMQIIFCPVFSNPKHNDFQEIEKEIIIPLPEFMKDVQKIFNKDIQIQLNNKGDIGIVFSQIDILNYQTNIIQRKSRLYILKDLNIVSTHDYSYPIFLNSIGNYFLITKAQIEGNDLVNIEMELIDNKGNLIGTIPDLQGRTYQVGIKNNCIALFYNDANNFGKNFTVFRLKDILHKSQKNENTKKWQIRFEKTPQGFLLVGGENLEYIVAFGNSIWKSSLIEPENNLWKIKNIGEEINELYYAGKNFLGVKTFQSLLLIDINTGKIVFHANRASKIKDLKDKNVIWNKITVNNSAAILSSYQQIVAEFDIKKIRLPEIKVKLTLKSHKTKPVIRILHRNNKLIEASLKNNNKLKINVFPQLKTQENLKTLDFSIIKNKAASY